MNFLRRRARSPYLVGALIGLLSWFAFLEASVVAFPGCDRFFEASSSWGKITLPQMLGTNSLLLALGLAAAILLSIGFLRWQRRTTLQLTGGSI